MEAFADGIDLKVTLTRAKFESLNAAAFESCLDTVKGVRVKPRLTLTLTLTLTWQPSLHPLVGPVAVVVGGQQPPGREVVEGRPPPLALDHDLHDLGGG